MSTLAKIWNMTKKIQLTWMWIDDDFNLKGFLVARVCKH